MMTELYDLCENLVDDIRELTKKGDISPTELDRAFKAVDIIKDIKTIEAMEDSRGSYDYSNDGYSGRRMYYDAEPNTSHRSYAEGHSEARGRDAMGRYTSRDGVSRDGYSGHEEKEHMLRQIEQMKHKIEQM